MSEVNCPYAPSKDKVIAMFKTFSRVGAFPIDVTTVFNTLEDFENYINVEGTYAYPGQVVAVANGTVEAENGNKDYSLYIIRSDMSIQEIGKNHIFNNISEATSYITSNADLFTAGQLITIKKDTEDGFELFIIDDPESGSISKDSIDTSRLVGKFDESDNTNTAEIFNDYETNKAYSEHSHAEGTGTVAGKRCHLIMSMPNITQFVLESVDGLKVGYTVSYAKPSSPGSSAWSEHQNLGKITAIAENTITLDTEIEGITDEDIQSLHADGKIREKRINCRLWVNDHPEVGIYTLSRRAHAEGRQTQAIGDGSHTEGKSTKAIGPYAHAEGGASVSYSESGHAEGRNTKVLPDASGGHSEGAYTEAHGYASHAEGENTKSIGRSSHSEGAETTATGTGAHSEGRLSNSNGDAAHAEGLGTNSSGPGAHSEGHDTNAKGEGAHAEGVETNAEAFASHSEGYKSSAKGSASHSEGAYTLALASESHAGGKNSRSHADQSFAHGLGVHAYGIGGAVFGKYNIIDKDGKYVFILGNGTSDTIRSNALAVDYDGNVIIYGDISANNIFTKDETVGRFDKTDTAEIFNNYETNKAYTEHSHAEGTGTVAGKMAHLIMSMPSTTQFVLESVEGLAVGYTVSYAKMADASSWTECQDLAKITNITGNTITLDTEIVDLTDEQIQAAHAKGDILERRINCRLWVNDHPEVGTYMMARRAHAEGRETIAIGDASHSEGKSTKAVGPYAHTEGGGTKAYAESGHAEGRGSVVSKTARGGHAEGEYTEARGTSAHAEGTSTLAEGDYSHAGGLACRAFGDGSFAHGRSAFAYADFSYALGTFPEYDGHKKLLLNIGNGTSDNDRRSALTLDFQGNMIVQGGITANNIYNKDEIDSKLATGGNIVSISESDIDTFSQGYAIVTASSTQDSGDGAILTEYKYPLFAESVDTFGNISINQIRLYDGKLQQRYVGGEWINMTDNSDFDVILNSDTIQSYTGQTITNKTVFLTGDCDIESILDLSFNNCVIHGNRHRLGTLGTVAYTNCVIYDLNIESVYNADKGFGSSPITKSKLYNCSIMEYTDPNIDTCELTGCSLSGYGLSVMTKDSIYTNCDFGSCYPMAKSNNTYNHFINCKNMMDYGNPLTGECYFSGCRGSISISSSATLKPSTTTTFTDNNFMTISIQ